MPDLILDSLEVQNYRGLRELRIERLGRVNLIVGKNNVGKTSVLEALRLYSKPGSSEIVLDLLESRDHYDPSSTLWEAQGREYVLPFQHLFFLEGKIGFRINPLPIIRIGKKGLPGDSLSISIGYEPNGPNPSQPPGPSLLFSTAGWKLFVPMLRPNNFTWTILRGNSDVSSLDEPESAIPSVYLGVGGVGRSQLESLWNGVVLTPLEDDVIEAMRLIARDVERLVFKPIDEESKFRVPFVRLKDVSSPISLRSLGDGMSRVFGIALALVNAKNGFLLIDEFENGLHYSVQPDIWRMIFESARRLNVQVFATTHSLDCVKAFEVAARESPEEGVLVRLAQKAGRTLVGEFDETDLKIAVEGQIEVR